MLTATHGVTGPSTAPARTTGFGARMSWPGSLTSIETATLFIAGCATNQGKFYPQFDHVVLLSAPADVLLDQVTRRTDNPYGKSPEEQALILRYLREVEPLLRKTCTAEIDAAAPLVDVVRQLEALADCSWSNTQRCE